MQLNGKAQSALVTALVSALTALVAVIGTLQIGPAQEIAQGQDMTAERLTKLESQNALLIDQLVESRTDARALAEDIADLRTEVGEGKIATARLEEKIDALIR